MTEHAPDVHIWTPVQEFDEFVELCGCDRPHLNLLTDPELFSTTQRGGRMGPVTLQDVVLDADTSIDCGDLCSTYRVFLVRSGRAAGKHKGLPAGGGTWIKDLAFFFASIATSAGFDGSGPTSSTCTA